MNNPTRMRRRQFLGLAAAIGALPLAVRSVVSAPDEHLEARPEGAPSKPAVIGEGKLGLGTDRDGILYVPRGYDPSQAAPLAVMLHGAGQNADRMRSTFPLADEFGVVILAPDSRGRTWDSIQGQPGPDVDFIDAALRSVFTQVRVNPRRLALGGFSDGASYALGLGLANGDLFSHLIALSPGFITSPRRRGKPPVWVSHGTLDRVLPIDRTSRVITPALKTEGYSVLYREFEGPHRLLPEIAHEAFEWFVK